MNRLTNFLAALLVAILVLCQSPWCNAQTGTLNQASMTVGTVGSGDWCLFYKWNGLSGGSAKWTWNKENGYDFLNQFTNSWGGVTMWHIMTNIQYSVYTNVIGQLMLASNSLAIMTNQVNTLSNGLAVATNNLSQMSLSISNMTAAATNYSYGASNTVHAAIANTNTIIQAELSAIQAGLGGTVSSGGNATLGTVTASQLTTKSTYTVSTNLGTFATSPQTIDLSTWQLQACALGTGTAGGAPYFTLANPTDGENVTLVVTISGFSVTGIGSSTAVPAGYTFKSATGLTPIGVGIYGMSSSGGINGVVVLNWEVIGTTVYFSESKF